MTEIVTSEMDFKKTT